MKFTTFIYPKTPIPILNLLFLQVQLQQLLKLIISLKGKVGAKENILGVVKERYKAKNIGDAML